MLGPFWGHIGAILGPLGAILGPSWAILGHLEAILSHPGAILGHLGAILGPQVEPQIVKNLWFFYGFCTFSLLKPPPSKPSSSHTYLRHLKAILWPSRAFLEPSWAILSPSWGHLGPILGHLGPILGSSWAILGSSWGHVGSCSKCNWVSLTMSSLFSNLFLQSCAVCSVSLSLSSERGLAECAKRLNNQITNK